jgi:Ca-activated chloride channel family protein
LLKLCFVGSIFIALAHPFKWEKQKENDDINGIGIDMLFVLDVSESMQAMDLKPNRLSSAKKVIEQFVSKRKGDRIGLVSYAGEAYSLCPRTIDHSLLLSQLKRANGQDMLPGTAIGVGLGTAVAQLKGDTTESKAIILLTDGTNNRGTLNPEEAALLAKSESIRVYSIGVGTNGYAPMPDPSPFGLGYFNAPVEIDEEVLKEISAVTGGKYFRATDSQSLKKILFEIDKIEKKRIKNRPDIQAGIPLPYNLLVAILILGSLLLFVDFYLFKSHE